MKLNRSWLCGAVTFALAFVVTDARGATAPPNVRTEVLAFVRAFEYAANKADVAAVMEMYDRSPSLTSVTDGQIVRGWEAVREDANQVLGKEGYYKISMGSFDVIPLGATRAVAVGPLVVTIQTANGPLEAKQALTMVLEKRQGKWVIIHDHTSTVPAGQ